MMAKVLTVINCQFQLFHAVILRSANVELLFKWTLVKAVRNSSKRLKNVVGRQNQKNDKCKFKYNEKMRSNGVTGWQYI
jgi:hypothetical protein